VGINRLVKVIGVIEERPQIQFIDENWMGLIALFTTQGILMKARFL
jgi:hypothetical protein